MDRVKDENYRPISFMNIAAKNSEEIIKGQNKAIYEGKNHHDKVGFISIQG